MSLGLLFLRVVIGTVFAAHGVQKLFGWFGGGGPRGTGMWLGSIGFRWGTTVAVLVGLAETSGILFAGGLGTPFVALAMATVMVVAVGAVHWKSGFWNSGGGFEFNLSLWAVTIAVAGTGPGRYSLDHLLKWDDNISGQWWSVGVAGLSLATGAIVLASRRET
jgi:putative oxidoreductase